MATRRKKKLFTIVKIFIEDTRMQFGIDKCAKDKIKVRKIMKTTGLDFHMNKKIKKLHQNGTDEYLGNIEGDGIERLIMTKNIFIGESV